MLSAFPWPMEDKPNNNHKRIRRPDPQAWALIRHDWRHGGVADAPSDSWMHADQALLVLLSLNIICTLAGKSVGFL